MVRVYAPGGAITSAVSVYVAIAAAMCVYTELLQVAVAVDTVNNQSMVGLEAPH